MQGLRSRAGIVTATAGALALLSVPVVALAKGPPDVVGGGTDTAGTVVPPQAQVPDPPPGQVNKPAPAPKQAPPGQAKAPGNVAATPPAQGPPASAPGSDRRASAPGRQRPKGTPPAPHGGNPPGHAKRPGSTPAEGSSDPVGAGGEPSPSGAPDEGSPSGGPGKRSPSASPDEPDLTDGLELPRADTPGSGGAEVAGTFVGDTVELPEDASPDTLPFTGLQLALIALAGIAALAAGLTLHRGAAE
jgi:hypothetical protein